MRNRCNVFNKVENRMRQKRYRSVDISLAYAIRMKKKNFDNLGKEQEIVSVTREKNKRETQVPYILPY